eukprot:879663-Pleurochrysis_carterae.AAC.1
MTALKTDAGEAGHSAADLSVLFPLTRPEVIEAEAALPVQADGVQAVARLVSEPVYGGAAWAAVFSSMKYMRERCRQKDEVRALAEAVLCADLALDPVVKLLSGRRPSGWARKASSFDAATTFGRWGDLKGELFTADGVTSAVRGFGLAALAREACVGVGSLSTERGRALLRDLLDRLRRAAE